MTAITQEALEAMIAESVIKVIAMSPDERAEMWKAQRESFVRAEAGFGSDADESKYRAALKSGDADQIAECKAEEDARIRAAKGEPE